MRNLLLPALVLFSAAPALVAQSIPATINYQGRLTDNTPGQAPVNTTVPMRFTLWDDPTAGTNLWQEPAAGGTNVLVDNGIFNVALGANGVPIPTALFSGANSTRYLEITLNPGPSQEILAPRQRIGSTGYAALAQNANSAASASNAANLGGQPAANYLLVTATAADSAKMGGVADSGWQKKLTPPACPAGQSLTTLNQDGSIVCAAPAPAGALDFGSLSLPGSAAGLTIAVGTAIPFATFSGAPPDTTLSYSNPSLTIATPGTYLVTVGIHATTTSNCIFQLNLNGGNVSGAMLDTGAGRQMTGAPFLLAVPLAASTLRVVNAGGAACTLNNGSATSFGVQSAYLTILRLR